MGKKVIIFLTVIILAAFAATASWLFYKHLTKDDEQKRLYNQAIEAANNKDFETAVKLLRGLDYEDSKEKLSEIIKFMDVIDLPQSFSLFSKEDSPEKINEKYGSNGTNTLFKTDEQFRKIYENKGLLYCYKGNIEFIFTKGKLDNIYWTLDNASPEAYKEIKDYLAENFGSEGNEKELSFSDASTGSIVSWGNERITFTRKDREGSTCSLGLKKEYY
ncbi:MAG: hypothetical protein IJS61_03810 [Firmicutes bacterium]|nr:hypothetical protein [Bacillota bacterium]